VFSALRPPSWRPTRTPVQGGAQSGGHGRGSTIDGMGAGCVPQEGGTGRRDLGRRAAREITPSPRRRPPPSPPSSPLAPAQAARPQTARAS